MQQYPVLRQYVDAAVAAASCQISSWGEQPYKGEHSSQRPFNKPLLNVSATYSTGRASWNPSCIYGCVRTSR